MTDMSPDPRDEELRALLHEAVAEVEPADRLGELRRRTRGRAPARRWTPLLVGAGAVAATVVAAGVVVSTLGDEPDHDHDTPVASSGPPDVPTTAAAGIYFVGDSPTGPRLYREFQVVGRTDDGAERVLLSLQRLAADDGPRDPDYETVWPDRSFSAVRLEDDRIVVDLGEAATQEAPAGYATLGIQQAVYTAEAAIEQTLPVAFEVDGRPARTVLGMKVGELVERDRSYGVLAPVNISDPGEHLLVDDGVLRGRGAMTTDVPYVDWRIEQSGRTVLEGRASSAAATGADATMGAPGWVTDPIDVSALPAGEYLFVVTTEVAGQTSDSPTEFSDTRTITIR